MSQVVTIVVTVLAQEVGREKSQTSTSCMSTTLIQYSLSPTSQATNQTLYPVLWDVIPRCYKSI